MYYILVSLAYGPQHGYGIRTHLLGLTEGVVDLPTGTLYPAIRSLVTSGYVAGVVDGEQTIYTLTATGEQQLGTETTGRIRQVADGEQAIAFLLGRRS
jgi:DNA-binding PadR family transcriptional regulator